MAGDFTYEAYAALLDDLRHRDGPVLTVREYLEAASVPEGAVVLRHDVDRKPENALDHARLEADRGLSSTYYVRTEPGAFDPDVIRDIAALGHEVGYHYEDLDREEGDVEAAHRSFATNLERVRRLADVDTVCMHGNPLTPYDNRDMWASGPDFAAYDLLGEAYLSVDFTDLQYYSDTGRTWRDGALKVKDHPVGDATTTVPIETTFQLRRLLEAFPDARFYLLTHPERWTNSAPEWVVETSFDVAKNTAKYALGLASRR